MKKNKLLYKESIEELSSELINLLHEQFKLHLQAKSGQLRQTHLLQKTRRDISRIKTLLTIKADK